MPDRDTALIIAALGLPQHLIEVPPRRIKIEIQVQIDIDIEGLREIEQFFELRHRIGVHVRATADQIAAARKAATRSCSVPGSLVSPSCGKTQIERSIAQA